MILLHDWKTPFFYIPNISWYTQVTYNNNNINNRINPILTSIYPKFPNTHGFLQQRLYITTTIIIIMLIINQNVHPYTRKFLNNKNYSNINDVHITHSQYMQWYYQFLQVQLEIWYTHIPSHFFPLPFAGIEHGHKNTSLELRCTPILMSTRETCEIYLTNDK